MARYSSEARKMNLPDQDEIRKIEYFQSLYPQNMKLLRSYVVEECDYMDYPGSPIYDEYPDLQVIRGACKRICSRIPEGMVTDDGIFSGDERKNMDAMDVEQVEIYEAGAGREASVELQQLGRWNPGPNRPPWGRPPGNRPPSWGPPGHRPPSGPPPWGPPSGNRPPGHRPPSGPPPWGPPGHNRPLAGPPSGRGWLHDIIQVLFMNELQNRRCRTGRC